MKQTNINFKKKKKTQGSKRWSLYLSGCENLNNCFKTGKKKNDKTRFNTVLLKLQFYLI